MDEAKRFLRYVTPGLMFLTETLILLWVIEPDVIYTIPNVFNKESGVGLVLASLFASGGVGFMFSVVHHWLHWFDQLGAVDHRPFVASLRTRGIIRLRNRNSGYVLSDTITPNRFQAWCIVTGLWHERLAKEDSLIKGADPRASSLADLVHSLGTARVAAVMAYIFTILILRETCVLSWEVSAIIRFVAGSILTVFFVYLCWDGYRRAGEATQRYVEQVLDDALTQEQIQTRAGVPIDTYFAPSSLEKKMNIRQQALIVVPLIICVLVSTFGVVGYFMGIAIGLPIRFHMPPLVRGVGVIVLTLGFLFMGWLLRYRKPTEIIISTYVTMRKAINKTRPDNTCSRTEPLILQGPQRHVRHPMYFAVVVLVVGWWLMLDFTFLLFMAFFFFLWFNLVVIRFEEKELRSVYGEEYAVYAKTVPRFFPSWKRRWR